MPDGLGQELDGSPYDSRHVAARVDDGVPPAIAEEVQPIVAVAVEMLCLRKRILVTRSTVEQRDFVPALERDVRCVASEEVRPSEEQDLHERSLRTATSERSAR